MLLLVNDDGIDAPGFRALYRALRQVLRQPVLAVAPGVERSGQSHAITIHTPLRITPRIEAGFFGFAVDGTPTDCVKLALDRLCPTPPELVISGINRGPNVGRSLFYSGTVGAAMEAAVLGLPAMAVSRQLGFDGQDDAAGWAAGWAKRLIGRKELSGKVANLNCPATPAAQWKATVAASHGMGGFRERYRPVNGDQGTGWMLEGEWEEGDEPTSDVSRLSSGHPVVTLLAPSFNTPDRWLAREVARG